MDLELLKSLPKVALHDHLDGGLRAKTVVDHLGEIGHEVPSRDPKVLEEWFYDTANSGSLVEYLTTFDYTVAAMRECEHLFRVAKEAVEDLAADGVVYAELRYAPEQHTTRDDELPAVVEAVRDGLAAGMDSAAEAGHTISAKQILTSMRHGDPTSDVAELALKYRDEGVVGFDIAGAEDGWSPKRFLKVFELLRRNNFPFTIHAGEAAGCESIFEALQYCGADRLGHGVRIIEDVDFSEESPKLGRLAQFILDRQVPVEVCPTSNLQTGIADDIHGHPVKFLYHAGFNISINCDNRLVSGTSMSEEFKLVADAFGWGLDDFRKITVNAMQAAFAHHDEKQRILNEQILPGYDR